MKRNNIRIIGIPEGEEEEQGIENLFEKVMMENFPNLIIEKVVLNVRQILFKSWILNFLAVLP